MVEKTEYSLWCLTEMLKVVFDAGSSQHGNTSRAAFFFGCIIKVHLDFIDGTA